MNLIDPAPVARAVGIALAHLSGLRGPDAYDKAQEITVYILTAERPKTKPKKEPIFPRDPGAEARRLARKK